MPDWVEYVRQRLALENCPPEREEEICQELAEQMEEAYRENLQSGLNEGEAFAAAEGHIDDWTAFAQDLTRSNFGQAGRAKEQVCSGPGSAEGRFARAIETIWQDLRYALRMAREKPLFGAAVVTTLAVGLGANTAIFSVVDSVLLRPLPYPKSDRLAVIWSTFGKEGRAPSSGPELESLRERSQLFDQFAGIWVQGGVLTGRGEPEQVKLGWVTANFLSLVSARPEAGRFFVRGDEGEGREPVVVISHELWQRRYASAADLVGRTILLSGQSCRVVGILPAGFKLLFPEGASVPANIDVYAPFQWDIGKQSRDQGFVRIIGRLRDGATISEAQAELDRIGAQLRSEFVEYGEARLRLQALSLQGDITRDARPALLALFAGTGLVLAIACANVAMLLLARVNERRSEMSVRAALGADPGRLVRQLLTESAALSLFGGLGALAVAWGVLKVVLSLEPAGIARTTSIRLNVWVLAFNTAAAIVCGVLAGLLPARDAKNLNLQAALRGSRPVARELLVGGEVALTFVLLISSVLLGWTFAGLLRVEPGFKARNVLTFQVSLPGIRYRTSQSSEQFFRELQRRVSAIPGFQSVGAVSHLPFDDGLPNWYDYCWREGAPKEQQNTLMADHRSAYSGFFDSMGIQFVGGRNFDSSDEAGQRKVAIVDDSLARRLWPGGDAIGKRLNFVNGDFVRDVAEVVGVVRHVQYHSLTDQIRPQIYVPYHFAVRSNMSLTVLAKSPPDVLAPLLREEVRKIDRDLPLANIRPMEDYVSEARRSTRFVTFLCGSLGAIALLLSVIGIYGVTAGSVTSRTKEIGVRSALGARRQDIAWMILRKSMAPVVAGSAAGLAISFGALPLISSSFSGIRPLAAFVPLSVFLFLCVVGLVACGIPMQRALRANPTDALRHG